MKHIFTAIDVGSNSVRMMTAETENGRVTPIDRGLTTTRLIAGMENNILTPEAIIRTSDAIAAFVKQGRELGADRIEAFGTSAMRDALNSSLVSGRTEELCGLRVKVISGEEEAALAYAGAAPTGHCGVIDIGGGSTEMIAGENGISLCARSARMGAVRLMDRLNARLNPEEMVLTAREVLHDNAQALRACAPDKWMGVGGTITTLAAMDKKVSKYTPNAIENHPVTLEKAQMWLKILCAMPVEQRLTLIGLPPRRADIIPYGAAILVAAMEELGTETVFACDHDNLEGYISKAIKE